jgi:hypothetical protein
MKAGRMQSWVLIACGLVVAALLVAWAIVLFLASRD